MPAPATQDRKSLIHVGRAVKDITFVQDRDIPCHIVNICKTKDKILSEKVDPRQKRLLYIEQQKRRNMGIKEGKEELEEKDVDDEVEEEGKGSNKKMRKGRKSKKRGGNSPQEDDFENVLQVINDTSNILMEADMKKKRGRKYVNNDDIGSDGEVVTGKVLKRGGCSYMYITEAETSSGTEPSPGSVTSVGKGKKKLSDRVIDAHEDGQMQEEEEENVYSKSREGLRKSMDGKEDDKDNDVSSERRTTRRMAAGISKEAEKVNEAERKHRVTLENAKPSSELASARKRQQLIATERVSSSADIASPGTNADRGQQGVCTPKHVSVNTATLFGRGDDGEEDDNELMVSGKALYSLSKKKSAKKAENAASIIVNSVVKNTLTGKLPMQLTKIWNETAKDLENLEDSDEGNTVKKSNKTKARRTTRATANAGVKAQSKYNSRQTRSRNEKQVEPEAPSEPRMTRSQTTNAAPKGKRKRVVDEDEEEYEVCESEEEESEEYEEDEDEDEEEYQVNVKTNNSERVTRRSNRTKSKDESSAVVAPASKKRKTGSSDKSADVSSEESEGEFALGGGSDSENETLAQQAQQYFDSVGQLRPATTSNNTLADLDIPKMDQSMLNSCLEEVSERHVKEKQKLFDYYKTQFPKWKFALLGGEKNMLFYGFGSKKKLLTEFVRETCSSYPILFVNGYFPGLAIKQILKQITDGVLGYSGAFRSNFDHCDFICNVFNGSIPKGEREPCFVPEHLILVINNIDGVSLRKKQNQLILSQLATARGIHLVASIDHINAVLMWDNRLSARFSWLWHDTTTFEQYSNECSYETSMMVKGDRTGIQGITYVLNSLTPNAINIFRVLCEFQLEGKTSGSDYKGISYRQYFTKCKEEWLVNSDMTMRTQLTEFKDHQLINFRKGSDGVEYLHIPVANNVIEQTLEHIKEIVQEN
eukprot:Nk52_evm11s307 gene=Nk52_evmTU11s307